MDSGVLLTSQLAAVTATSALAILIARTLDPHNWGLFAGFLALGLALSVVAEFGLTAWLLRELSSLYADEGRSESDIRRRSGRLVAGSFLLSVSIGAAFVAATAIALLLLGIELRLSVAVVSLVAYGALLSASTVPESYFRSQRRLRRIVAATSLEKGLLLALVAALVVADFGLVGIAVAYAVAGSARLVFDGVMVIGKDRLPVRESSLRDVGSIVRGSLPFGINRAFLNVIPRTDTFVLAMIAPVAAGYFALGDRLLGPALIVPAVAGLALYPFLAREENAAAGWRVVLGLAALGLALAGIAVFLAPALVPLLFGETYRPAIPVVQVMLLALPFVYASNPLIAQVYSTRREGRRLMLALAAVSVAGTGAVVAGQALVGPIAAAGGYVLRQALFVAALVTATLITRPTVPLRATETIAGGSRPATKGIS